MNNLKIKKYCFFTFFIVCQLLCLTNIISASTSILSYQELIKDTTTTFDILRFGKINCCFDLAIYLISFLGLLSLSIVFFRKNIENKTQFYILIITIFIFLFSCLKFAFYIFEFLYLEQNNSISSISPIFFMILYLIMMICSLIPIILSICKKYQRTLPVKAE